MRAPVSCSRIHSLKAQVAKSIPLWYDEGADDELDRPAYVRAGSSLLQVSPGKLAVVQDDANFVAVITLEKMQVRSVPLPADASGKRLFDDKRGTKKEKMDLEASVVDDQGRLILFGSGSSGARERIAIVALRDDGDDSVVITVNAHTLYAALRNATDFSGSDLNIEGATRVNNVLRLFNRNNSKSTEDDVKSVNASCDLDWNAFLSYLFESKEIPTISNICQYDLGVINGVNVGFTDATTVDEDNVLFSGAAEDSSNATLDGPVTGSVIGVIRSDGLVGWTEVTSKDGTIFLGKIEGLTVEQGGHRGYAIVDRDSIDVPSELLVLELEGFLLQK